ncbi:MAG: hypothetical protein LQ352_002132 [Teloschistes flavicans]|nr:MAG: hypothetical protein LQ352_002132 [Teloschistes flavicans]
MSFFEAQSWQLPMRQQASWDEPPPPSRSGANSAVQRDENSAFDIQIEEVDRALDNLSKTGKLFTGGPLRRDSMPMMGGPRSYSEYGSGGGGYSQHRHSVGDYDQMRSHSGSNLQSFYASQRQQSRPNEAEQMMQAKRRMAAQRERELRNYHQEQQYNRMSSQNKSDRATSPNTMNEEDRRELIARQHRALYGNDTGALFEGARSSEEGQTPRPGNQSAGAPSSASGTRGASPRTFDPYAIGQNPAQNNIAEAASQAINSEQGQHHASTGPSPKPQQQQQRSRTNSNASPASANNQQSFSLFENAQQQSSRTSTSSPGDSSPHTGKPPGPTSGSVAPIGTRPAQSQAVNPALNKRSTTPIPSPLGYGFASNESQSTNNGNERSTSAASNPAPGAKDGGLAWGSSSGVWGNKNPLGGVQQSVWG